MFSSSSSEERYRHNFGNMDQLFNVSRVLQPSNSQCTGLRVATAGRQSAPSCSNIAIPSYFGSSLPTVNEELSPLSQRHARRSTQRQRTMSTEQPISASDTLKLQAADFAASLMFDPHFLTDDSGSAAGFLTMGKDNTTHLYNFPLNVPVSEQLQTGSMEHVERRTAHGNTFSDENMHHFVAGDISTLVCPQQVDSIVNNALSENVAHNTFLNSDSSSRTPHQRHTSPSNRGRGSWIDMDLKEDGKGVVLPPTPAFSTENQLCSDSDMNEQTSVSFTTPHQLRRSSVAVADLSSDPENIVGGFNNIKLNGNLSPQSALCGMDIEYKGYYDDIEIAAANTDVNMFKLVDGVIANALKLDMIPGYLSLFSDKENSAVDQGVYVAPSWINQSEVNNDRNYAKQADYSTSNLQLPIQMQLANFILPSPSSVIESSVSSVVPDVHQQWNQVSPLEVQQPSHYSASPFQCLAQPTTSEKGFVEDILTLPDTDLEKKVFNGGNNKQDLSTQDNQVSNTNNKQEKVQVATDPVHVSTRPQRAAALRKKQNLSMASDEDNGHDHFDDADELSSDCSISSGGGRRVYTCPAKGCRRAFARNYNLSIHMSIHDPSRKKRFICPCGKQFFRQPDLVRHRKVVHRDKDFSAVAVGRARDMYVV